MTRAEAEGAKAPNPGPLWTSSFIETTIIFPLREQVNYKRRSKESCVSILREVRGELPEPGVQRFWDFLQPTKRSRLRAAKK
jgi:hypothetical protein